MMNATRSHRNTAARVLALVSLVAGLTLLAGCGEDRPTPPPSLDGPSAISMASRAECGSANPSIGTFRDGDGKCRIGLVTNAGSNRLAVVDLGRKRPVMIDLADSIPSVTHIPVGRHPIDVAAAADGSAAYTLNSVGGDISVVDLWTLQTHDRSIEIPGTPKKLLGVPGEQEAGRLVAALSDPDQLWVRPGVGCDRPDGGGSSCSGFEASAQRVELPGSPADISKTADEDRLYVVYRDRNYMSEIALPGDAGLEDGSAQCIGSSAAPPCEIERIGLTYGCSDGVDNDGDGAIDQRDEQCWGPKGAESPDGIGRHPTTPCNDGADNDGDGGADRSDPDCQAAADTSESDPLSEEATFACSNGSDDDGDGATDYPEDPDCYGPKGRTESSLETTGFDSVSADDMGAFVYVVDRADSQVLIVDAERGELIDAPASMEPTAAPFNEKVGVPVGERPAAVTGFVSRRVIWRDPADRSHGIVQHNYGAYAASDNGNLYFVHAIRSECEVEEPNRDELLRNRQFRADAEAFEDSAEKSCIQVPEFPLAKTDETGAPLQACSDLEACESCLRDESVDACEDVCENRIENRHECRTVGRELQPNDAVRVAVNPKFGLRDSRGTSGRVQGRGTCDAPELFLDRMQTYADPRPDVSRNFGCDSPLRDQPLSTLATDEELDASNFESIPRVNLLRETSLQFRPASQGSSEVEAKIATSTYDYRFRSEGWTVTWEGVLPNTQRDDGLLSADTPGQLDVGSVDACSAGVREGDRLIIRSNPKSGDKAPDACEAFVREASDGEGGGTPPPAAEAPDDEDPYLTYRVAEVRPRQLQLETRDGAEQFVQELPTRECFPKGLKYEIRPEDTWVVSGKQTGFPSKRSSELGRCVPQFGADTGLLGGRVSTDSIYQGPYFEFLLYDGPVEPLRRPNAEFTYQFGIQRFFSSDRFGTDTILPTDVFLTPFVDGGVKVMVSEGSDDFVYVRNLTDGNVNPVKFR